MKRLFYILLSFFVFSSLPSKAQLAIEDQSAFLDSVIVNFQNSNDLTSIEILDKQLDIKNQIIDKIKFQLVQLDKDIRNNESYYKRLNTQLDDDKKIYADLIVKAQMYNSCVHRTFDLFSLDDIYTAYRQFLYLKYLSSLRKKKIQSIKTLKVEIQKIVSDLDSIKILKGKIAEKLGVEQSFIRKYGQSRFHLLSDWDKSAIIQGNQLNKNNLDSIKFSNVDLYDSSKDSSDLFEVQKGYLIWPVRKAAIIGYFGEKQHPVYEKVTIKNDGLDFLVPNNSIVSCVYNGTVVKITLIAHNKYVVIVRHGNYYTVYNGMDTIDVSLGDVVVKGDVLGRFESDNVHPVLNFQIWHGSESIDPNKWLTKSVEKQ